MVVPAKMLLTVSVHDDTVAPFETPTMLPARKRMTRFAAVGAAACPRPLLATDDMPKPIPNRIF
jgi:hypothetical protein